jgi:cytochrome c oxidase subunit 2
MDLAAVTPPEARVLYQPNIQSVLQPYGPHADAVAGLSWVLFYGGGAILFMVMAFTAYAVWAPKRGRWASGQRFIVIGGLIFPVVTLSALLVYGFSIARAVVTPASPADLRIEVTGEQWWWRVHYLDANGAVDFVTANELRIPAGRAVDVLLKSADVIHSFWVPNLAGKLDMIPGHVKRLRLKADRPGVFRGQCAEYCGGPHARMAFYVIAQDAPVFEAWRVAQRGSAVQPEDAASRQGQSLFLASCAACHTVQGTSARGTLGPDLTHVGSRMSIGAGILPNNRGALAAWISSSQHIKPGNLMPSMNLYSGEELNALAAYLAALL